MVRRPFILFGLLGCYVDYNFGGETIDTPGLLKDVICPQCKKPFELSWDDTPIGDSLPYTLRLRSCPSGGIYDVLISCPHCDYEEDL